LGNPGTGHRVAEEPPKQTLAALTTFLTPYRATGRPRLAHPRLTATTT
jgi:hypothetical protein